MKSNKFIKITANGGRILKANIRKGEFPTYENVGISIFGRFNFQITPSECKIKIMLLCHDNIYFIQS